MKLADSRVESVRMALLDRQWEEVAGILDQYGDHDILNAALNENHMLLFTAIANGAPADLLSRLVTTGNVQLQDTDGTTALLLAASEAKWEQVLVLLEHGADINRCDGQGTALHRAVCFGAAPINIVTQLMSPKNIDMLDSCGNTALHLAVRERRWEIVSLLVQNGANLDALDQKEFTPLHLALVLHNAPVDAVHQLISPRNINMEDVHGNTPLHLVSRGESWRCETMLLKMMSAQNINSRAKDFNLGTPLQNAVSWRCWELIPMLLQHGADPEMLSFPLLASSGDCLAPPLKDLCIKSIRNRLPAGTMTDKAYGMLGLPRRIQDELKLRSKACEIVDNAKVELGLQT